MLEICQFCKQIITTYSCVKGTPPKVGDRVLVEARYNANMPFKWNAMRIQVLPPSVSTCLYVCMCACARVHERERERALICAYIES